MRPLHLMTHTDYCTHLTQYGGTPAHPVSSQHRFAAYARETVILAGLSLDPVRDDLAECYCPTGQGDPRDPTTMLRSWLLMTLRHEGSPTRWVETTRTDPVLAVLAGFDPHDTPGVGTYYDFLARLADGPYAIRRVQDTTVSQYLRGRHTRSLHDRTAARQEDARAFASQSAQVAAHLLARADAPRDPFALQTRLQHLFVCLGLRPTLDAGLIADPDGLVIHGDGTILAAAASARGHSTCACAEPWHCTHPKAYTSATAQWCHDAAHDRDVFGDRYYTLTLHVKGHDVPLLTLLVGGNESDYTLSLKALDDLLKVIRDLHLPLSIGVFVGDGHHDAAPIYQYLKVKGILPIIPLTKTDPATTLPHPPKTQPDVLFDMDGTPFCPGGKRLRYHGFTARKHRYVYVCPARQATHRHGRYQQVFRPERCPRQTDCHPQTGLGYCVTLKAGTDPRLFPPLPRDSTRFKALYAERTSVERSNSVDDAYDLDHRCRNAVYALIRLTFVNICKHAVIRWREAGQTTPLMTLLAQALAPQRAGPVMAQAP